MVGVGNNLVSTVGSNARLAQTAREIGLGNHVILHPGHWGPISERTLATTLEALLGAIYLDSGKDMNEVKTSMTMLGLTPTG